MQGIELVLVEEDEVTARGMVALLEEVGCRVRSRSTGLERLQCLGVGQGSIVLVGLTPQNAGMLALLTKSKANVMVYSSSVGSRHIGDAIAAGSLSHLERQLFTHDELLAQVNAVNRGSRFVSQGLAVRLLNDMHARPLDKGLELTPVALQYLEELSVGGRVGLSSSWRWQEPRCLEEIWQTWERRSRTYQLGLSVRQIVILSLLDQGLTSVEIANRLCVSVATVRGEQDRIKEHVAAVIGVNLKRDTACRRAWHLLHGSWHVANESIHLGDRHDGMAPPRLA
jgi:DNA-binding NarL/FixJ family response regulator